MIVHRDAMILQRLSGTFLEPAAAGVTLRRSLEHLRLPLNSRLEAGMSDLCLSK
jgi:hypothetical protein